MISSIDGATHNVHVTQSASRISLREYYVFG